MSAFDLDREGRMGLIGPINCRMVRGIRFVAFALMAVAAGLLATSCMSLDMIARAEGKAPPTDPQGPPYQPQPAYYALVPVVFPLDLISLPVQYFYFHSNYGPAASGGPPPQAPSPPPYAQY